MKNSSSSVINNLSLVLLPFVHSCLEFSIRNLSHSRLSFGVCLIEMFYGGKCNRNIYFELLARSCCATALLKNSFALIDLFAALCEPKLFNNSYRCDDKFPRLQRTSAVNRRNFLFCHVSSRFYSGVNW